MINHNLKVIRKQGSSFSKKKKRRYIPTAISLTICQDSVNLIELLRAERRSEKRGIGFCWLWIEKAVVMFPAGEQAFGLRSCGRYWALTSVFRGQGISSGSFNTDLFLVGIQLFLTVCGQILFGAVFRNWNWLLFWPLMFMKTGARRKL